MNGFRMSPHFLSQQPRSQCGPLFTGFTLASDVTASGRGMVVAAYLGVNASPSLAHFRFAASLGARRRLGRREDGRAVGRAHLQQEHGGVRKLGS